VAHSLTHKLARLSSRVIRIFPANKDIHPTKLHP
jgi:hypothetical protein